MTRVEAQQIVWMIKLAWPSREFTEESFELYVSFMLDLPAQEALAAVQELIGTGGAFAPSIGEMRTAALERVKALPSLEEALEEVARYHLWWGGEEGNKILCARRNGERTMATGLQLSPLVGRAYRIAGDWREGKREVVIAAFRRSYLALRAAELKEANVKPLLAAPPIRLQLGTGSGSPS